MVTVHLSYRSRCHGHIKGTTICSFVLSAGCLCGNVDFRASFATITDPGATRESEWVALFAKAIVFGKDATE